MSSETEIPTTSKKMRLTGRIMSGLSIVFLLMDGVMKLIKPPQVVQACQQLGITDAQVTAFGIVLIVCTLLYAIPRTSILGAILLTGYLGGATATHVHAGQPFYFPIVFGVIIWGGLYFRDARIRALIPLK